MVVNGNNALATRAKFEVDNPGSDFNMSEGTLTILRGGGTTYGDLFLRPSSGSVTGGTILLGTQNAGAQTIRFDANLPLNNLTLDGVGAANSFQLMVNPLELNGNLLINSANSTFMSNSLNVSLKGNFTNNGTYTPGTNITTFNGTSQNINGSTSTQFYDLVIAPSGNVTLFNHITVNNDLTISSGTFSTSTYNVNIKGDLANNAVHSGDNTTGGLLLNGNTLQLISGSGIFGRMELNNASGARLLNNISFQQNILFTSGILNINQFLITLGVNSNILGSGFDVNKMIMSDGVINNVGVEKTFSPGITGTVTYPLGVSGKYTPAILDMNNNPSGGTIRVNVINERHPTVSDPNNVLQYYWELESSGLSTFEGNLKLYYSAGDVLGTESEYVAARLIIPPGEDWSKAATGDSTDNVDETLHIINFDFPDGTTNLGGEYTAGTDPSIPDEVPVYTSNTDGDWDDINVWTPEAPPGGPNGFIVIIRPGDVIATNGNRRFAYRTTINGVLDVGTTYGHNLGHVSGTGKLYLETATLPAGRFTSFFHCSGGTLEYGGSTNYTIIADRIDTLRNLFFTGTGNRILPDKNLVICDTLKIDGPSLINGSNKKLTLFGTIQRLNTGKFSSGSGPNATLAFSGSSVQTIGGINGSFTGTDALYNLEMNNISGLILNSPLELNGDLRLNDGVITTTSANKLSMLNGNAVVTPTGGSATSYISGPISKRIFGGNDFEFPTGKSTRYGKTVVLGVSDGTWEAEYFNTGYSSSAVTAPLTAVSSSEYWHIKGPAGKQAYVKLRWDPLSDVTPLTTLNGISDIRVAEYNTGSTSWVGQNTTASGDNYNGTAQTDDKMTLDEHDYTLGSISALKPRASFASTADACLGDNLSVVFSKTAGSYSFTYNINGGSNQPVTTSSNPYTLATTIAGRYRLTGFTGGVVDTNSVLVRPVPTASLSSSDADNTICEGQSVTFTAVGGTQYHFYVNGASVQNGISDTYTTALLGDGDIIHVIVTNSSGCTDASTSITMTVHPLPVPTLLGNQIVCTDAVETYTTDAGMSNYVWSVSAGGTISAGGSGTDNNATITWTAIGNRRVEINYTNANGCTAATPVQLPVTVYRRPDTGPSYYVPNTHNR